MVRTTTCALLLALSSGLAAQQVHISPFAARDDGLVGAPPLVGLAATAYSGPFGLRLSGAMDAPSSPIAPLLGQGPSSGIAAWAGDIDMVLSGARPGLALGPLEPSLLVGFGVHGIRRSDGSTATIPTWSYGGGVAVPVASWLSVDAEARYRMPHEHRPERLPAGVGGGWELRTGLSLRLGTSGSRTRRGSVPAPSSAGSSRRKSVGSAAVAALTLNTADRYVGVPYVWGGESPAQGFDCSGFVQYVFARNDIRLPRVSRNQARAGVRVQPLISHLREGDLLFFAGDDGVIDHVAIYAGDRTIIHSSSSGGGVAYDRLDSRRGRWYATHIVTVRRVIP